VEITPELVKFVERMRELGAESVHIDNISVSFGARPVAVQSYRDQIYGPGGYGSTGSGSQSTQTQLHYGTINSEAEKYMMDALRSAGS